jgi:predicted kinase
MKSLSLAKPHLIVVVGVPGSGKSFFAEKFADTFNAPLLSEERILPFARDDDALAPLFNYQLVELMKTKQTLVIDGGADMRTERAELAKYAHKEGYDVLFVWVQTDPATAKGRAQKGVRANEYETRLKHFAPPIAIEKPVVISGKHTYASQAKAVLKKLSSPRAEISAHSAPPIRTTPPSSNRRNISIR